MLSYPVKVLKELSVFNTDRLLWVPGHSGVDGNEEADSLATQASYSDFIGPEPAIGITVTTVRSEIRSWTNKEHTVTSGMRTGLNRYDLSAGQLIPVRPEGKVRCLSYLSQKI